MTWGSVGLGGGRTVTVSTLDVTARGDLQRGGCWLGHGMGGTGAIWTSTAPVPCPCAWDSGTGLVAALQQHRITSVLALHVSPALVQTLVCMHANLLSLASAGLLGVRVHAEEHTPLGPRSCAPFAWMCVLGVAGALVALSPSTCLICVAHACANACKCRRFLSPRVPNRIYLPHRALLLHPALPLQFSDPSQQTGGQGDPWAARPQADGAHSPPGTPLCPHTILYSS